MFPSPAEKGELWILGGGGGKKRRERAWREVRARECSGHSEAKVKT